MSNQKSTNLDKGKISVIMGIYNCASTLPDAIDSILNQTYSNWELIMCDDCSTDNTHYVAEQYANNYPEKIILVRNSKNMHLAYSLNHCLRYAKGEYVARMDGDDISAENRFEKEMIFLQNHPELQLVGAAMQQFNDNEYLSLIKKPELIDDKNIIRKCIPFNHATILTYKWVFDSLGGYTVAKRTERGQDYDLWFRFLYAGFKGGNIQEPLYYVREDMGAFKRRTFKVRWSVFQTTRFGYNLLGYPKKWLLQEFCITLFKSLTPAYIQKIYREIQSNSKRNSWGE